MKIGELSQATATNVETVRYYEKIGLLPKPRRTEGNYRDYEPDHVKRLSFIRRARDLGFPLDQVRELLSLVDDKDRSCDLVDEIAKAHVATVERKRAELKALGDELDVLIRQCGHGKIGECRIIEALADSNKADH